MGDVSATFRLPPAGEHGGDGARLAAALGVEAEAVLDLSQSLNPCAPDVVAAAVRRLGALRRYPDPAEATLALAVTLGADPDRVVLTNGGSEAIALVAAEVGEGWVKEPEFSLYGRHLASVRRGAGRWRSNPRNPTGELAASGQRAAVWDEAFWPLATGTWTRGDADRGATVVGSLTKTFACPGLRVGYVVCGDGAMAERLRSRQPAWSVSGLACALVPDPLDAADVPGWARVVRALRRELVDLLEAVGFAVHAADAPWVVVPEAGNLRARLAAHAILVRDCSSFGLVDTVRIGVPDERGLERMAAALPDLSAR
jgi:histidinol-phosphate/aromatic aminotransferase/cobyric acid decarboxylase-like protein